MARVLVDGEVMELVKAGPYIGPKGGKWADPEHKIPWKGGGGKKLSAKERAGVIRHALRARSQGVQFDRLMRMWAESWSDRGYSDEAWAQIRQAAKVAYEGEKGVMKKAEPRGGSYHRRVARKSGKGYNYYYDEDSYNRSKNAHVDGKSAKSARLTKGIMGAVETAGKGGCAVKSLAAMAAKEGQEDVAAAIKGCVEKGDLVYKAGKLYPKGTKVAKAKSKSKLKLEPKGKPNETKLKLTVRAEPDDELDDGPEEKAKKSLPLILDPTADRMEGLLLADELAKARGHKYLSRKWVRDKWVYVYEQAKKLKTKLAGKEVGGRNWVAHKPGLPDQTVKAHRLQPPPKGADPKYKKERQKVHADIRDQFLKDSKGNPIQPQAKKVAIVMMGGTASGKTTAVKRLLDVQKGTSIEDKGFVNFNPDDVKEMLPEYQESIDFEHGGKKATARDAAWMVHEESSDIAHDVLAEALEKGLNVIVDGTGKNADKHIARIRDLKERGYEVQLVMPDVDVEGDDGAIARSLKRAERTGRFVPTGAPPPGTPDVLRDIHYQIPGNFERVAREADSFTLFDGRGFPPTVKWKGGKGAPDDISDPQWVEAFKARGKEMAKKHAEWKEKLKTDKKASAPRVAPAKSSTLKKSDVDPREDDTKDRPFKGAGKNGIGVVWPVTDGFDPKKVKRIKYA